MYAHHAMPFVTGLSRDIIGFQFAGKYERVGATLWTTVLLTATTWRHHAHARLHPCSKHHHCHRWPKTGRVTSLVLCNLFCSTGCHFIQRFCQDLKKNSFRCSVSLKTRAVAGSTGRSNVHPRVTTVLPQSPRRAACSAAQVRRLDHHAVWGRQGMSVVLTSAVSTGVATYNCL